MGILKPKCPKCNKRDQVGANYFRDWWKWFCFRCQHKFK